MPFAAGVAVGLALIAWRNRSGGGHSSRRDEFRYGSFRSRGMRDKVRCIVDGVCGEAVPRAVLAVGHA